MTPRQITALFFLVVTLAPTTIVPPLFAQASKPTVGADSARIENHAGLRLVDARRIWDQAPHNAFTDLIRFQDRWYCVFREGKGHVSPDGALRVITSPDGEKWESAALIESENSDLRDAKITVTPDGRLMLAGAEAMNQPVTHKHQSLVWFSEDGKTWSDKREVGVHDNWLWRVTWHDGQAYGFGYGTRNDNRGIRFFRSSDGEKFETLIEKATVAGTYPNETSLVFLPDDTCYCLLRQDGNPNNGYLGESRPPYTSWSWRKLNLRIGGPDMIRLPDGRLLAAVRLYDSPVRTSLCWLDAKQGKLTEALTLPSGGDTSYAGLVWHDDLLWVSYYASHEGKTAIYLAKVEVAATKEGATKEGATKEQDAPLETLVDGIVRSAGGKDKLLKLFRIEEQLSVGSDPDKKGKLRISTIEPPANWWIGKRQRDAKEPARYLAWAWTLGAVTDPQSKLELIPSIVEGGNPAFGIRVSGSITPPMDLYFDQQESRLVRIDWKSSIHRLSDWREHDDTRYPAKCVGYKKKNNQPWYFSEIVKLERLEELPAGLER